jgi:hypothetical protein
MKTLQGLQLLILQWAKDKDLLKFENAPKQRLKLLEEVGETAAAILKNNHGEIKDGIGDIFVVLVILAEQLSEKILFDINGVAKDDDQDFIFLFDNIINSRRIYFSLAYLNDICTKLNLDLTECANLAWNEIKDRTGQTIDGNFIKNN